MKTLLFFILFLTLGLNAYCQETFFAVSDPVLHLAEEIRANKVNREQATQRLVEIQNQQDFNTTDLSVIRKYIDPQFQLRTSKPQEHSVQRLHEMKSMQESKYLLSKNHKILWAIGIGLAATFLAVDSQGKKIVFTW